MSFCRADGRGRKQSGGVKILHGSSSKYNCAPIGRNYLQPPAVGYTLAVRSPWHSCCRPSLLEKRKVVPERALTFRYDLFMQLIFEVREAEEGGYIARALGQAIFTEAETWEQLRENVLEVTNLHFEDAPAKPKLIQLHFVKDELIPVEAA